MSDALKTPRKLLVQNRRVVLWMLVSLAATVAAEQHLGPGGGPVCYFAEPMTGRKVLSYEIELAVGRDEKRSYTIPDDCDAVSQAFDGALAYKGSIMDRRFWMKVTSDCRYFRLLNRYPTWKIQDFVSDFDFANARLDILPFNSGCPGHVDEDIDCHPTFVDPFGKLHRFPLLEPLPDVHPPGDAASELRDGVFRGFIYANTHGLHCVASDDAPSLRLVGVDFADINGDGYLDAVLRFLPTGPGHLRRTILLPVTRFAADGEFQLPVSR